MSISEEILEKAYQLFDVAGATVLPDGYILLIMGLESTPKRNLDEFGTRSGRFMLYGFQKYIAPRLRAMVKFIRDRGYYAETFKKYGYPLKGEINLKNEAIRAGLGKRGENSVVLHPKYGPWLRFTAIRTKAPLEFAVTSELMETYNPVCRDCHICLDVCPTGVLESYHMIDPSHCLSNITAQDANGRSILCDKCLIQCPAGARKIENR
jgi:epoxyqueuosine reductase QueG